MSDSLEPLISKQRVLYTISSPSGPLLSLPFPVFISRCVREGGDIGVGSGITGPGLFPSL